jgi:heme-degrading monooxygenase HmoA
MITRIFRARIKPELRADFELKFADISIQAVKSQQGNLAVEIGKPTIWAPDEYVMISRWEDEESLRNFVGENWAEAHIPKGMEKFIRECWLHHYTDYDKN